MSNSLSYRCGELFDKGHLLKCKAMNQQWFTSPPAPLHRKRTEFIDKV